MKIKLVFLLLLVILIKYIQSKKSIRKFVLIRDDEMDKNGLSQFSILDSREKQYLYRLKSSYDYNDALRIVSYPSKDVVGYLQGQWKNETLNVTFQILDLQTNQWANGTITKIFNLFVEKYLIQWNYQNFIMKKTLFSIYYQFYDENKTNLGQFRMRFRWFNWSLVKYDLKIFIDKLPDFISFFTLVIIDHRNIIL